VDDFENPRVAKLRRRSTPVPLTREEITRLARFAATIVAEVDSGSVAPIDDAISSFTEDEPGELVALARRAWREIERNGGFENA